MAKQHSKDTTFGDVRKRLNEEFLKLETDEGQEAIHAIIEHVDKVILKFMDEIRQEGNNEEQDRAISQGSESISSLRTVSECTTVTELDSDTE